MKTLIWIFMTIGTMLGAYLPLLWGDTAFSISSVFFSGIGGFMGIWLGYKIGRGW